MSEEMMMALKDMLSDALGPVMRRLEEVEKLAAEGRDDERKAAGETEAGEMTVVVPDGVEGEALEAVAEVVEKVAEGGGDSEMGMGYSKLMDENEELRRALEALKAESVMAEARAQTAISELKQSIARREAEAAVAVDLQGKPHLSQMSERLVGLYNTDRDLYTDILNLKPDNRSSLAERQTRGYTPAPKAADVYDAALKLQHEKGITFADALKTLQN